MYNVGRARSGREMSFAPLFAMMGVVKKERRVGSALRGWGRRRGGKRAQKIRLTWWLYFSPLPVSEHSHVADSVVDRRALDTIEHVAAVAHILDNILTSFPTFFITTDRQTLRL